MPPRVLVGGNLLADRRLHGATWCPLSANQATPARELDEDMRGYNIRYGGNCRGIRSAYPAPELNLLHSLLACEIGYGLFYFRQPAYLL